VEGPVIHPTTLFLGSFGIKCCSTHASKIAVLLVVPNTLIASKAPPKNASMTWVRPLALQWWTPKHRCPLCEEPCVRRHVMGKSRFIDKPHESALRLRCSDLLEECRPFFRARLGVIEGFFYMLH
jgi:hypothetical protein